MTQIPIYRAKKKDSDEYVIGYYSSAYDIHHYIIDHLGVDTKTSTVYTMSTNLYKIDPSTLAIHFPDMLDSKANKIFASLSEDGKGGDIFEHSINCRLDIPRPHDGTYWVHCESPLIYKNFRFCLRYKIEDFTPQFCNHKISNRSGYSDFEKSLKIIGIKQ